MDSVQADKNYLQKSTLYTLVGTALKVVAPVLTIVLARVFGKEISRASRNTQCGGQKLVFNTITKQLTRCDGPNAYVGYQKSVEKCVDRSQTVGYEHLARHKCSAPNANNGKGEQIEQQNAFFAHLCIHKTNYQEFELRLAITFLSAVANWSGHDVLFIPHGIPSSRLITSATG